jgi:LysM repeat protein
MNLNLVDMVKGQLPGEFLNKASSLLGESRDKTQMGIDAAVPGVLAGLADTASTTDGATRLASLVDDVDEGVLSGTGAIFGRTSDWGTGALRSVLGGAGLSDLSGSIGRTSGLSGKSITTLLGALAPIIFGVLKRVTRTRGLDSSGLASLLSGQRDNIASAMPEGMRTYREPLREIRDETYRTARPAATRETEDYPTGHRRSSLSWLLPLAALALLAALIWNWASRPAVRAGREEKNVAEETARLKQQGGQMASLEALKTKYSSAIEEARKQGVKISSMTHTGGKLAIEGTAPSAEAADKAKEAFRRINPKMDDVALNLSVDSSMATPSPSASAKQESKKTPEDSVTRAKPTEPSTAPSPESAVQNYTVEPGDTLGKISQKFYGDTKDYMRIFNQNRSQLKDANSLSVGQTLEIPAK